MISQSWSMRYLPRSCMYYLTSMLRAVVALTSADLLSHTGARSASLCTVDDVALGVSAATVVLVEVLRAHFEDCFPVES